MKTRVKFNPKSIEENALWFAFVRFVNGALVNMYVRFGALFGVWLCVLIVVISFGKIKYAILTYIDIKKRVM